MLSPRLRNYLSALDREGDNFDYFRWLERVREEEAQANWAFTLGESPISQKNRPESTSDRGGTRIASQPLCLTRCALVPKARLNRKAKSKTSQYRVRQRLEKVCAAWATFHNCRGRDAVYEYLEAVYRLVMHYKVRRRTSELLQHAFEFGNVPFEEAANVFSVLIRCTCDNGVDNKTISKWSRALRFVAKSKTPKT